jgi:Flp pilus assembly protein TadG
MVELALTLLGFILLTMGTMEFGWAIYAYNNVSYLAQSGARWASVSGSLSTSPATEASVLSYVQSQIVAMDPSLLTVVTNWCDANGNNCSTTPTYNTPGCLVQVTVGYTVNPLAGLALKQSINLNSTAQFVINH